MAEILNGGTPLFQSRYLNEIEQLLAIFNLMGTPGPSLWPKMCQTRNFNPAFPAWPPLQLNRVIPHLDGPAVSLLNTLLAVDPSQRLSCRGALGSYCLAAYSLYTFT
jgi:serine/threonine protein kinase